MEDPLAGTPPNGVDVGAALAWMQAHPDLLRTLLEEEAEDGADPAPAGDAAIRAHLRYLAAALEETLPDRLAYGISGLFEELPQWFEEGRQLYDEHLAMAAGAIALEEHLQFRTSPGSDPSLDESLDRRARLGAWTRLFLLAVEERLGPAADGLTEAAMAWMAANQRTLMGYVIALDRRARTSITSQMGPYADRATLDQAGQAAVVQGHLRLVADALAVAMSNMEA
jgi:hypothetical protein